MTTLGATSRSKTSRVREVTFGTTPANPAFVEMPVTSNGLKSSPTQQTSATITSDAQPRQTLQTKFQPGGAVKAEIRFSDFDGEFEAVMRGAWASKPSNATASAIASEVVTVASGGASFVIGMLCLFTGFGGANEGVLARVASSGSTEVTFGSGLTDEGSIPTGAKFRMVGFQGASGDIVAAANGLTSTTLDFTTLDLNVGEWIWVGGDAAGSSFATSGVGGWCQILSIAAHAITFNVKPSTWATDAGTSKTIEVFTGDFLTNGVTQYSYSIERWQRDVAAPLYEVFPGEMVDSIQIPLDPEKAIEATINYVGFKVPTESTSRTSGATDTFPSTYLSLVTAANLGMLSMGGSVVAGPNYVMSASYEIAANLQRAPALGMKAGTVPINGEASLKGNLSIYLGDGTFYGNSLNDTYLSFTAVSGYPGTTYREAYVFDAPHIKVTLDSDYSAKSQARMVSGSYLADAHPVLGFMAGIGRFFYRPLAAA